jgi:hypothetical protein
MSHEITTRPLPIVNPYPEEWYYYIPSIDRSEWDGIEYDQVRTFGYWVYNGTCTININNTKKKIIMAHAGKGSCGERVPGKSKKRKGYSK